MEITLSIAVSEPAISPKTGVINELAQKLKGFFQTKNYGADIDSICVGLILVFSRVGYENWYQEKKIKYIESKLTKSKLTGEIIEINKRVTYEIKFSDNLLTDFITATDQESTKIIISELMNSLSKLEFIQKKIKNFDKLKFKSDMEQFIIAQNLS